MSTRQGYIKDYEGNKIAPETSSVMVLDVAREQALSASLMTLIEKNALGYPTFVTTEAHAVGDKVFYDRRLWKFTSALEQGAAWDPEKVTEFSLKEIVDAISTVVGDSALETTAQTVTGGVNELKGRDDLQDAQLTALANTKAAKTALGYADFSEETEYAVGDYAYYNGKIYKFTAVHIGEWDADDVAETSVNDEVEAKLPISDYGKWGVVSSTITWNGSQNKSIVTNPVYGWISNDFIKEAEWVYGATFAEETGYFTLNTLDDISEKELRQIIRCADVNVDKGAPVSMNYGLYEVYQRTNVQTEQLHFNTKVDCRALMLYSTIEILYLRAGDSTSYKFVLNEGRDFFYNRVRKVIPTLDCSNLVGTGTTNGWYGNNYIQALEECHFYHIKIAPPLKTCSMFSNESILYMIENEDATAPLTVTLHADAYARAMADDDILAALEEHTNISLASA